MEQEDFYKVWRDFQGKSARDGLNLCPIAEEFRKKIEDWLIAPLSQNSTRQQVAFAKFQLQEEYHTWRKSVPAKHVQDTSAHHQCLSDVYDSSYDRLHLLELSLRPASSFPLQPPEPEPVKEITPASPIVFSVNGIALGEVDDEN
jgi:hypothetical protein